MTPDTLTACSALLRAGREDLASALEHGTKTPAGVLLELRQAQDPGAEIRQAIEAVEQLTRRGSR
jgi:hypothetical protein